MKSAFAFVVSVCLSIGVLSSSAYAEVQESLSIDSPIGDLLDDPVASAVLAAHLTNFVDNPAIDQLRPLSLRGLAQLSPQALPQAKLDELGSALSAAASNPNRQAGAARASSARDTGAASTSHLSADSSVGDLLDDAKGRAILAQEMPDLQNVHDLDRLRQIPLRTLQQISPLAFPREKLDRIDQALAE